MLDERLRWSIAYEAMTRLERALAGRLTRWDTAGIGAPALPWRADVRAGLARRVLPDRFGDSVAEGALVSKPLKKRRKPLTVQNIFDKYANSHNCAPVGPPPGALAFAGHRMRAWA